MLTASDNPADYLNYMMPGYTANQTAYDAADNGLVTSSGGSTTITAPTWGQSLLNLFGSAAEIAGTVAPLINGKPASSPANPAAKTTAQGTAPATATATPSNKTLWWIVGGAVAAVLAAVLMFRKK